MKNDFIKIFDYMPKNMQEICLTLALLSVQRWLLKKKMILLREKNMQDAVVIENLLTELETEFKELF